MIKPNGVVEYHFAGDILRQSGEVILDDLARARPGGVGMREIRAPHVIVLAEEFEVRGTDRIVQERRPDLTLEILAGFQRQRRIGADLAELVPARGRAGT